MFGPNCVVPIKRVYVWGDELEAIKVGVEPKQPWYVPSYYPRWVWVGVWFRPGGPAFRRYLLDIVATDVESLTG